MRSAEDPLLDARDAYSSAILLALLVMGGQVIGGITSWGRPLGVPIVVRVALAAVSTVALAYLLATRKRPREGMARITCVLLIVPYLFLVPWAAVRWGQLGRPFEAFTGPEIAMVAAGLVVPRSFRLGLVIVAAFFVESLAIYAFYVRTGMPRASLPITQPAFSFAFAAIGVFVVVIRRRRRDLVLAHLRVEARRISLTRASTALQAMTAEMTQPLGLLAQTFAGLGQASQPAFERARRAIERLAAVRTRVSEIVASAPPLAPLDESRPTAARRLQLSETERQFYARDAHAAARAVSVVAIVGALAAMASAWRLSLDLLVPLFAAQTVIALATAWTLHRRRARPSEALGIALFFLASLPFLGIMVLAQPIWASVAQAFEPMAAAKALLVVLALAAPRHLWLAMSLELFVVAEGFVLYYANHFQTLRDRSPMSDPWMILLYLMIGSALLIMREQRRVISLRLLRADQETAALIRQTQLSATLLHLVGSPLQTLYATIALLPAAGVPVSDAQTAEVALRELNAACERVPGVEPRAQLYVPSSFDDEDLSRILAQKL